jgi:hypothetical protein
MWLKILIIVVCYAIFGLLMSVAVDAYLYYKTDHTRLGRSFLDTLAWVFGPVAAVCLIGIGTWWLVRNAKNLTSGFTKWAKDGAQDAWYVMVPRTVATDKSGITHKLDPSYQSGEDAISRYTLCKEPTMFGSGGWKAGTNNKTVSCIRCISTRE